KELSRILQRLGLAPFLFPLPAGSGCPDGWRGDVLGQTERPRSKKFSRLLTVGSPNVHNEGPSVVLQPGKITIGRWIEIGYGRELVVPYRRHRPCILPSVPFSVSIPKRQVSGLVVIIRRN